MPGIDGHTSTQNRKLTVINNTMSDQNFGILAQIESIEVVPNVGMSRTMAWRVALVPGQSEGVSSRRCFTWHSSQAFILGRFSRNAQSSFLPEAVLPLAADINRRLAMVGFVGTCSNGSAKLLRFEAGSADAATLRTDGSVPTIAQRSSSTRDLAIGVAFDTDSEDWSAVIATPLAPHMTITFKEPPIYRIAPLGLEIKTGDVLTADIISSSYVLDFSTSTEIRLSYDDNNTFENLTD